MSEILEFSIRLNFTFYTQYKEVLKLYYRSGVLREIGKYTFGFENSATRMKIHH